MCFSLGRAHRATALAMTGAIASAVRRGSVGSSRFALARWSAGDRRVRPRVVPPGLPYVFASRTDYGCRMPPGTSFRRACTARQKEEGERPDHRSFELVSFRALTRMTTAPLCRVALQQPIGGRRKNARNRPDRRSAHPEISRNRPRRRTLPWRAMSSRQRRSRGPGGRDRVSCSSAAFRSMAWRDRARAGGPSATPPVDTAARDSGPGPPGNGPGA